MIKHIKRLLGIGQTPVAPTAPAPYKVEALVVTTVSKTTTAKPKTEKKPAVKAKTARKPKSPKS